jgi:hypothetical protein
MSALTYLALAALNRVVAPRSKAAFADWWYPPLVGVTSRASPVIEPDLAA